MKARSGLVARRPHVAARLLVAVVAEDEGDRAALSSAMARHPEQRVACSTSIDSADTALATNTADAIVGFVEDASEWARFRALAARHPALLSVVLLNDPAAAAAVADGRILNAVASVARSELAGRAALVAEAAARAHGVAATPLAEADAIDRRRLGLLSEREREVLVLTARGDSMKEIARRLNRAYATIATHRTRIMQKLDIHDKVALTRFAIRCGLVDV